MTPTKAGGAVKKVTAKKATAKKAPATKAPATKATAQKSVVKKAGTKKAAPRRSTSARHSRGQLRHELTSLVNDVRTALDELAVKGDLATMEGRDRVQAQVVEIENRWLRVKQELGFAKSEADSTLENLRFALAKAEDAVRHIFDAAIEGMRRS
ncbi:MAG: hypothetical protein ACLP6E_02420 [Acidimicrobiales bacterium]